MEELKMSPKDLQIVRQSSLKSVPELASMLGYTPSSLAELLRFNEIICTYCLFGATSDEVKKEIKTFDDYLKKSKINSQPINVKE